MARGDVTLRRFVPRGKKVSKDAERVNPVDSKRMKSAFSGNPRDGVRPEDTPAEKAPAKKASAKKKAPAKKAK